MAWPCRALLVAALVCTAAAEFCKDSAFSDDAACAAASPNRTTFSQYRAGIECNDGESPCTAEDCCNLDVCPTLNTGTYFEMYHKWFSCQPTTYVTTQNGNAEIQLDLVNSMGFQGRTWNIRAPPTTPGGKGAVVSSSRDEVFSLLQHVSVFDCNHALLAYFEIPFAITNTLYYLYNSNNEIIARVDMAWFEVNNYYLKPCINDPPALEKSECIVAQTDAENRVVKLHKNVFTMSEKWTATLLKPELLENPQLYTDPRVLAEMIVRQSKDGVSWCVLGIVLLVMIAIAWFCCAFYWIRTNFQNQARRARYGRLNHDEPAAAAAPRVNEAQERVNEFVQVTGAPRRTANLYLQRNRFDVHAATNAYFQDQEGAGGPDQPPWAA